MKVTLESTSRIIDVNGVPARVWEGTTAAGITVLACITRVAVPIGEEAGEFERDLQEHRAPSTAAIEAFPARMVI